MARRCNINGCQEPGNYFEVWVVGGFDLALTFCKQHHEESLAEAAG